MANNRLFILDPDTNNVVGIAKHYCSGWTVYKNDGTMNRLAERLNIFFDEVLNDGRYDSKTTKLKLITEDALPENFNLIELKKIKTNNKFDLYEWADENGIIQSDDYFLGAQKLYKDLESLGVISTTEEESPKYENFQQLERTEEGDQVYSFNCKECGDELRIAFDCWWDVKCSCGLDWDFKLFPEK